MTLGVITTDFCTDTYTSQITIHPSPVAAFTAPAVCEGVPTVFQNQSTVSSGSISGQAWDFGDNAGSSTNASPTYTYASAGTYPVTLGVTTSFGCIATTVQNVTVNALPTINASHTDILCAGQSNGTATVSASGGNAPYNYQWNDIFQSTSSVIQNLGSGAYNVTVTDALGCADDTTVTVVEPLPINVSLEPGDDTCRLGNGAVQAIVIGGTLPFSYNWSLINDSTTIYSEDITPSGWNTMLSAGDYSVVVTDAGGCTASASTTVGLISPPVADFTTRSKPEELIDPSVQFINESFAAETYEWHFGDGSIGYEKDPNHDYEQSGVYLVMLNAYYDPNYG